MEDQKFDPETSAIVNDLKDITDFTTSKGFEIIQRRLLDKIQLLTDVGDLPEDLSADQMLLEIKARKKAIVLINDWWKEDIIGSKNQYEQIKKPVNDKPWLITG